MTDLERQVHMYERLFQTLSAKLDHHFKRYDTVVNAQQQQITSLSDVITTLLNDQCRYTGVLREKLGNTLEGIKSTTSSMNPMISLTGNVGEKSFESQPSFPEPPSNPAVAPPVILNFENSHAVRPAHVLQPNTDPKHGADENGTYNADDSLTGAENDFLQSSDEEQSYADFQFLASPKSVLDIWLEYTKGLNRRPPLKYMEAKYGSTWRRDAASNRMFYRRMVLCRAIEKGLSRGYPLKEVIGTLEKHRKQNPKSKEKESIGWLCHYSNIPDKFK